MDNMMRNPLHLAVIEQQTKIVSKLITSKNAVNLDAQDFDKKTALDYAIQSRNLKIIKLLLDAGAGIFNSSLREAFKSLNVDVLQLLLDNIAVEDSDDDCRFRTLFELAVRFSNSKIIKLLLNSEVAAKLKANDKKYLLREAIKTQNLNVVKLILNAGVSVEAVFACGNKPLHSAVDPKNLEILQFLIAYKANVNAKNYEGSTPLHLATEVEEEEVGDCTNLIKRLLEAGANVNAVNNDMYTPLHTAVDFQNENAVKLLLDAGANVNVRNRIGDTPLHLAVESKNINILRLVLIKPGCLINAQNEFKSTPLHLALERSNDYASKMLLEAGAKVNLVDNDRRTPLNLAVEFGTINVMKMIIDAGVNSCLDYKDMLITLLAKRFRDMAQKDLSDRIKLLLTHFDVNYVDYTGRIFLSHILESDYYAEKRNSFYKFILEHIAKVKVLNLQVHSSLLDIITSDRNYSDYFNKCIKELENAKSTKLHHCHISFLNLLVDDKFKYIKYAGNQDLVKDSKNSFKKFPIYGSTMESNMAQGIEGRKLFDGAADILSNHLPILNPTHLIIRDTLDALTVEDWNKLCEKKRVREE